MDIIVKGNILTFNGRSYNCAIGKKGFSDDKHEGDNCTPVGTYALREVFYRADKVAKPQSVLPTKIIAETDGWCDAPQDTNYNKPVQLPFEPSHEKLWRDDDIYDVIVPLGYNDAPPVAGKGSAIFMHVARPKYEGTEGCVALKLEDILEVLKAITADSKIVISA